MNRFVIALFLVVVANVVVAFTNEFSETGHNSRIINGRNAMRRQFPFQAYLIIREDTPNTTIFGKCGGILICKQYVLTAAHCTENQNGITIMLGTINPYAPNDKWTVVRTASQVIDHPNYNGTSLSNDISIIKLNQTVPINSYIKTIYMSEEEILADENVIAVGWGRTSKNGNGSSTLLYGSLMTITNKECKEIYRDDLVNEDRLCAKPVNSENICKGDSGGPLVMRRGRKYHLVGNSVGSNCNSDPSMFTRINHFYNWIKSNVNIACNVHLTLTSQAEKQHSHNMGVPT